ncbi:DUF4309 domain-containing protein [Brevibacillus gelatini]|uniref:DUF4309 domain-containing protein n=1 Tax=Brevibacillus gelatini TaxID=1655277 RepID=UPI003D813C36
MYGTIFLMGMLCFLMLLGCSTSSKTASDFLEKVKMGQLAGVSIEIGATKQEVTEKLGEPIRTGNDEYGFCVYYDGFSLEFEDYAASLAELNENSKVVLIHASPKTVGLTGTPDEIKESLGVPSRELLDDTGDDTFILEYSESDYLLKLSFRSKDDPVEYFVLQIK